MKIKKRSFVRSCFGKLLLSCIVFLSTVERSFTQSGWTASPFEQKVFIENKGQFDTCLPDRQEKLENGSKVLFGASSEGVELYFTSKGLTYRHDELIPMTQDEKEIAVVTRKIKTEEKENDAERKMMKSIAHYLSMEWVGANPDAKIIATEPVSFYYTYDGKDTGTTIKAKAFKKITYKNLYPNIDAEYTFPENKQGIKYTLIVYPGGDPSLIKMKYNHAEHLSLEKENVIINSTFGKFVDHAPITFYQGDKAEIISSFVLNGDEVSFFVKGYDLKRTLIIDPWVTNPAFVGFNTAYDVNYDLSGNVYVCGSYNPVKLAKFNNAGVLQWLCNIPLPAFPTNYRYGDFAVDEVSGTSYIVEGLRVGAPARVFKVNTLGNLAGTFNGTANMNEMWRIEYNRCINKMVIGGGSTNAPYQAAMLDTNMINIMPVNLLSTTEKWLDVALLAIDSKSNFCYMAIAKNNHTITNSIYGNILLKCPVPNLVPLVFNVPNGHRFEEQESVNYAMPALANGLSGMSVSPSYLYTYDSDSLKRWNKNTGAFVTGIDVSPSPPVYIGATNSAIMVDWGGLSADECDNIFVGMDSSIKVYNTTLAHITTYQLPGRVYDVKKGLNNKLYACGFGFVTEITVPPNDSTVAYTLVPTSCNLCNGTATVKSLGCGSNPAGFNYSWSTSPVQTTQTATGLCAGTYTVTMTTNCFVSFTSTVAVTGSYSVSATVTSVPDTCNKNIGSATVSGMAGTAPYTYSWSLLGGSNATATGLGVGTYTTTITDAYGCTQTGTVIITSTAGPDILTTPTHVSCIGDKDGSATVTVTAGIPPYTYAWSTVPVQTTATATGLLPGTYTITVTDPKGCDSIQTLTITEPTALSIATSATPAACNANNGTATANVTGGTSAYTYLWDNGQLNPTATGLKLGTYTITITDANGCTKDTNIEVTEIPCPCPKYLNIPNAFSPNYDGENDELCLPAGIEHCIKDIYISIYDRWGEKVYESSNKNFCWNGIYNGEPLNTAVFVYRLDATLITEEKIMREGNISLLR